MLTPAEIQRLDSIEAKLDSLLALLAGGGQQQVEQPAPLTGADAVKRKALDLARQGRRAESIELIRSINSRRSSHA